MLPAGRGGGVPLPCQGTEAAPPVAPHPPPGPAVVPVEQRWPLPGEAEPPPGAAGLRGGARLREAPR